MSTKTKSHAVNIRMTEEMYNQVLAAKQAEFPHNDISVGEWLRGVVQKYLDSIN